MVDTGLAFPSFSAVVADEAARFRRASNAERLQAIHSVLAAGALLIERSPRRAFLEAYRRNQEEAAREAIRRFVARHAQRP